MTTPSSSVPSSSLERTSGNSARSAGSGVGGQRGLVEGVSEALLEKPGLLGRELASVDEIETLGGRYAFPLVLFVRTVVGSVAVGSHNRSVMAGSTVAGMAHGWERVESMLSWAVVSATPRQRGRDGGVLEAGLYFGTLFGGLEECHRLTRKERTPLSVVVGG